MPAANVLTYALYPWRVIANLSEIPSLRPQRRPPLQYVPCRHESWLLECCRVPAGRIDHLVDFRNIASGLTHPVWTFRDGDWIVPRIFQSRCLVDLMPKTLVDCIYIWKHWAVDSDHVLKLVPDNADRYRALLTGQSRSHHGTSARTAGPSPPGSRPRHPCILNIQPCPLCPTYTCPPSSSPAT